jgi:CRP/FNR family transcriptional regulator, cyclic AMP receptor protein
MENEIKTVRYSQGSAVLVENSHNDGFFYIVKSGNIKIQSEIYFYNKYFNGYGAGDTFGLVSGLTKNPARHTLIAESECEVIRVPIGLLGNYFQDNRNICLKIISLYSNQLRLLNNYLIKKHTGQEYVEDPEKLLEAGLVYSDSGLNNLAAHSLFKYIEWAELNQRRNQKKIEKAKSLLNKISPDFKQRIHNSSEITYETDEIVFVENEPADYFYVIEKGAVKISKLVNDQEFILCILRDGEIFGEMAILNNKGRNANAVIFKDSSIIRLSVETFMETVGEKLLLKIFESFARRIWYAHQRISLLDMDDPNAKLYAYLQILISDINSKNKIWENPPKEYIFAFTIYDLKKMTGLADIKDDLIRDFLSDENIDISNHTISILDRRKVDDKAALYKNRHRKKQLFDISA